MSERGVHYYPSYEMVQALVEHAHPVLQKDGRHVTASVIDFISRKFIDAYGKGIQEKDILSKFWVPLVDENGKIIGKLYTDGITEVD